MKYLPRLTFREDPAIATGQRVEEIIRELHRDDGAAKVGGELEAAQVAIDGSIAARRSTRSAARRTIALACHVSPDGDALGSMLGLYHVLRAAGRDVRGVVPDPVRRRAALPRAARSRPAHPPDEFPASPR